MRAAAPDLAALAHVLAEPIVVARGHARLLTAAASAAEATEHAAAIERALDGAQAVVDGLARLQRAVAPPAPEPVALDAVVRRAHEHVAARHDGAPGLHVRAGDALPAVVADPGQLELLLCELLDNAVSHAEFGEVGVTVGATAGDGLVELRVADDGPGIPGEAATALAPFRRVRGHSRRAHAGVGLAVCREIAQGHGGDLQLDAGATGGTTVIVRLRGAA